MADKSEWKTPSRKRREGRWTPIRAKAQDTRAIVIPNSPSEEEMRGIGLLRALSLYTDYDDYDSGNIPRTSPHFCEYRERDAQLANIRLHEHLTHATINVYSRAYD